MNQQPAFAVTPRAKAQNQYNVARWNLLAATAFTLVNVLLALLQTGTYFLFCADIPYIIAITGAGLYSESANNLYLIVAGVMAVVLTVPYLLGWIFSKKHRGWIIAILIYFIFDCIALMYFLVASMDFQLLIDLLFHAWVLYYLILGVRAGKVLATTGEDTDPAVLGYSAVADSGLAVPEDTPALHLAGQEEKIKVYAQATAAGHSIVYRRYGKNIEELVVDGSVYAEFRFKGLAKPHTMEAVVGGQKISAGYFQVNFITVNNTVVAQTTRWI